MADHRKLLWDTIYEMHLDRLKKVKPIITLFKLRKITESQARAYYLWLTPEIAEATRCINHLSSPPELDDLEPVDVELGTTETGLRVGKKLTGTTTHMLICGATGTGKTVLGRRFVEGVCDAGRRRGKPVVQVIIDPKDDFADANELAPGPWLILDPMTTLRMSPVPPLGVPDDTWMNEGAASFATNLRIIASRVGLVRVERFGVELLKRTYSSEKLWPNWALIADIIRSSPLDLWFPKGEWGKTVENALADVVENTGTLFTCLKGYDFDESVRRGINVVVSMKGLTHPAARSLLLDMIVNQIFMARLARHQKCDDTEVVLLIDESDEFISRQQEALYPLSMSPINRLLKQGREFGISVVLSASVLSNISPFVISNMTEMYIFNQADAESIYEAKKALQLFSGGQR